MTRYRERLRPSWWLWPATLAVALLMAAAVHSGYGGVRAWLPYVVAVVLSVVGLALLSRAEVRVADGELWVVGSRLPLQVVTGVRVLDRRQLTALARTGRHPDGYHVTRGWITGAVQVRLDDPADCTPYWLVSSRHPDRLADAVAAERATLASLP